MNLQSCFQEFLNHLLAEKNVSDQTITSYKTDFKIFVEFLNLMDIETSLGKITTPILRKYISYIKIHRKYKTNTIRRKVHSLSSFYKFLLEQEYIEKIQCSQFMLHRKKKTFLYI